MPEIVMKLDRRLLPPLLAVVFFLLAWGLAYFGGQVTNPFMQFFVALSMGGFMLTTVAMVVTSLFIWVDPPSPR